MNKLIPRLLLTIVPVKWKRLNALILASKYVN